MPIDGSFKFNPDMCQEDKSPMQEMEELIDLVRLDAERIQRTWIRLRDWWSEKLRKAREGSKN